MKLDEVTPVLDVHPPHETPHGWRDFLLHLFTITVGLLIALSLEGLVEWHHHKHLAHDAEVSLHREIASNAKDMGSTLDKLHKAQESLKQDVALLKLVETTGKYPKDGKLEIGFGITGFDDVSWKTAQTTGALSYMPYDLAQQYSDIYATQNELTTMETIAARDTIVAMRPFVNASKDDPAPSRQEATDAIKDIETLQGQLLLVNSFMQNLNEEQKKFLAAHPE